MLHSTLLLALGILAAYFLRLRSSRKGPNLPPGPKRFPFIGNIRQIPHSHSWLYYTKLKKQYGDIVTVSAFGHTIIVLNTAQAALDLLGNRSSIYSDRPTMTFLGEIVGHVKGTILAHYGPEWKMQRRLSQQYMSKSNIPQYQSRIENEAREYVLRLHRLRPEDFVEEFRLSAVRLILGVTYGVEISSVQDEFAMLSERVNHEFTASLSAGSSIVDFIPALQFVPRWFPGAGWQKIAAGMSERLHRMAQVPYEKIKEDVAAGRAVPSLTADMIGSQSPLSAADHQIRMWLSGSMFMAGSDTTMTTVGRFFLAMQLYPRVQTKIQEELDRVIGRDRLPTIDDKANLPYLDAVIKELFRWKPLVPLAVAHRLVEDDVYMGYLIPKGATIVPNSWAMSLDPDMYPDPEEFEPERFLPEDPSKMPLDPRSFIFGFGRRICLGMHFAEAVVFTTLATILSTSMILNPVDEHGTEIKPDPEFSGGALSMTSPFSSRILPRFEDSIGILDDAVLVA